MTRTLEEQETVYRWDADERQVWGWTAHRREADRWRALGYPVRPEPGGWRTQFPVEALALLPLKGGAVQMSRYLDPPVVLKGPCARGARNDVRNPESNRLSCEQAPDNSGSEGYASRA